MRFLSYRDPLISRHFLLYLPYRRSAFPRISFLVLFYVEKYFSHRGLYGEERLECRVSSPNRWYRTDTLWICSVALIGTLIIRTQAGICVCTCVSADKYSRISLLPIIVSLWNTKCIFLFWENSLSQEGNVRLIADNVVADILLRLYLFTFCFCFNIEARRRWKFANIDLRGFCRRQIGRKIPKFR